MSLQVIFPNRFTRKANKIARKHPSLIIELRKLTELLAHGTYPGVRLKYVGANVRKVRLGNYSDMSGKSGGFRIAYHVGSESVTLLAVCIKPKCDDVEPSQIRRILRDLELV